MTNEEKILVWEVENGRLESRAKEIVRRSGGTVAQRMAELKEQVEKIKSAESQQIPVMSKGKFKQSENYTAMILGGINTGE